MSAVSVIEPPMTDTSLDAESAEWVEALSSTGQRREEAINRLHALLLRAARFEVSRRTGVRHDLDDLATQAAADALMAVTAKLHTYRGASRFTTWAYKFAVLEAAVKVRRRAWEGREIPLEADTWSRFADMRSSPAADAETAELLQAVSEEISGTLTRHQRNILIAVALDGIPIDVLAERLQTTRGALYKTIHDVRRKLRERLAERGLLDEGGTE
jgi:RNA polymerase sigma-70 factor (ECF subfamily)